MAKRKTTRATKLKRWVWCFDSHGDMIDPATYEAFKMFIKDFQPDFKGHGGDAMDLRAWRKGASVEDRAESMREDVERGIDFLSWYKPSVFVCGNHDYRLWRVAADHHDGTHQDYAGKLIDLLHDTLGDSCAVIPYGKENYYEHADHRVVHGYAHGIYAARKHAQAYKRHVLFGHIHAFQEFVEPDIEQTRAISSGSLCRTAMDYNKSHLNTLRQENGWLYGFEIGGRLQVFKARRTDSGFIYPTEFKAVAA